MFRPNQDTDNFFACLRVFKPPLCHQVAADQVEILSSKRAVSYWPYKLFKIKKLRLYVKQHADSMCLNLRPAADYAALQIALKHAPTVIN